MAMKTAQINSTEKTKKRKYNEMAAVLVNGESSKRSKKHGEVSSSAKKRKRQIHAPLHPPFIRQRWSIYIPLSPISLSNPLAGACAEHLSPLILTYYPPFKAVILSYSAPRLSSTPDDDTESSRNRVVLGQAVDEYAASYTWLNADFTLFKPQRGQELEGWINLQTETHLSLVCWNYFTASIEKKRLPASWKWVGKRLMNGGKTIGRLRVADEEDGEEEGSQDPMNHLPEDLGHYEDKGKVIKDKLIKFHVVDIELSADLDGSKGFVGITGTLLPEKDERELVEQEITLAQERQLASGHRKKDDGTNVNQ